MSRTLEELRHKHAVMMVIAQGGSPDLAFIASLEAERLEKLIANFNEVDPEVLASIEF